MFNFPLKNVFRYILSLFGGLPPAGKEITWLQRRRDLNSQLPQDVPKGKLHGIRIGKQGGGVAAAVAAVYRVVLGQDTEKGQTVLFDFLPDARVQLSAGGPVDDEAHSAGVQVHFPDHFRDSRHRLDTPAGAVGNEKHGVHMGQGASGDMLQTRLVVHDDVGIIFGVLVHLRFQDTD